MRLIKYYANRKMYDTETKQYTTQREIIELIKSGELVTMISHATGLDVTTHCLTETLSKMEIPESILFNIIKDFNIKN